jgi:hypothetical protein
MISSISVPAVRCMKLTVLRRNCDASPRMGNFPKIVPKLGTYLITTSPGQVAFASVSQELVRLTEPDDAISRSWSAPSRSRGDGGLQARCRCNLDGIAHWTPSALVQLFAPKMLSPSQSPLFVARRLRSNQVSKPWTAVIPASIMADVTSISLPGKSVRLPARALAVRDYLVFIIAARPQSETKQSKSVHGWSPLDIETRREKEGPEGTAAKKNDN